MKQYSASKHSGTDVTMDSHELNIKERGCEGEVSIQVAVVSTAIKLRGSRRQIISPRPARLLYLLSWSDLTSRHVENAHIATEALQYRHIILSDKWHHYFSQTVSREGRQRRARRHSNFPWVRTHAIQPNVGNYNQYCLCCYWRLACCLSAGKDTSHLTTGLFTARRSCIG
jgi:hypothetical protein